MPTIRYCFQPSDGFSQAFDEFVARGCRVRLEGSTLSIEHRPGDEAVATGLGQDYGNALVSRLGPIRLLTLEELAEMPPWAFQTTGQRQARFSPAVTLERLGEVRRTLVEPDHPRLSQCYDYFQEARDDPRHAMAGIYKMLESIEHECGGEANAVQALNAPELKKLKRLANADIHDERHSPREPRDASRLSANEVAACLEDAKGLLRKFERRLTGLPF